MKSFFLYRENYPQRAKVLNGHLNECLKIRLYLNSYYVRKSTFIRRRHRRTSKETEIATISVTFNLFFEEQ